MKKSFRNKNGADSIRPPPERNPFSPALIWFRPPSPLGSAEILVIAATGQPWGPLTVPPSCFVLSLIYFHFFPFISKKNFVRTNLTS